MELSLTVPSGTVREAERKPETWRVLRAGGRRSALPGVLLGQVLLIHHPLIRALQPFDS